MRHSKGLINNSILAGLVIIGMLLLIANGGCGSSSSSGDVISNEGLYGSSYGTVALFLTDDPADEYDNLWITVKEASLIPAEGDDNRDPVVIYQSDEGCRVDLLEFRDKEFLLTVKNNVPAGRYAKIRLSVSNIEPAGGPCDNMEIKLPSSKIDFNPKEPFWVETESTLSISMDIDANKSIHLHPTESEGCIFRPVVFVDIRHGDAIQRCPQILGGEIVSLVDGDAGEGIEGFILALSEGRGELEVHLLDDVVVFDGEGQPAGSEALAVGLRVKVRGRIDAEGRLQASVVVIGDVLVVKGNVLGQVDGEGLFPFEPNSLEEVVGDVNVKVFEGKTLILVGCNNQVSSEEIQEGRIVRIIGKLYLVGDGDDGYDEFRAVAVVLCLPDEIPE